MPLATDFLGSIQRCPQGPALPTPSTHYPRPPRLDKAQPPPLPRGARGVAKSRPRFPAWEEANDEASSRHRAPERGARLGLRGRHGASTKHRRRSPAPTPHPQTKKIPIPPRGSFLKPRVLAPSDRLRVATHARRSRPHWRAGRVWPSASLSTDEQDVAPPPLSSTLHSTNAHDRLPPARRRACASVRAVVSARPCRALRGSVRAEAARRAPRMLLRGRGERQGGCLDAPTAPCQRASPHGDILRPRTPFRPCSAATAVAHGSRSCGAWAACSGSDRILVQASMPLAVSLDPAWCGTPRPHRTTPAAGRRAVLAAAGQASATIYRDRAATGGPPDEFPAECRFAARLS